MATDSSPSTSSWYGGLRRCMLRQILRSRGSRSLGTLKVTHLFSWREAEHVNLKVSDAAQDVRRPHWTLLERRQERHRHRPLSSDGTSVRRPTSKLQGLTMVSSVLSLRLVPRVARILHYVWKDHMRPSGVLKGTMLGKLFSLAVVMIIRHQQIYQPDGVYAATKAIAWILSVVLTVLQLKQHCLLWVRMDGRATTEACSWTGGGI